MRSEVTGRVELVYGWIVAGKRTSEMRSLIAARDWGLADRTIDDYIRKAKQMLDKTAEPKRKRELGKAAARFEEQYRKLDEGADHRGAVLAQKALCDLFGLNAPTRAEISGVNGGPIEFADAARDARECVVSGIARIAERQQADTDPRPPD